MKIRSKAILLIILLVVFVSGSCFFLSKETWKKKLASAVHSKTNGFFPESKLAHSLLDNLKGLEIGASAHNSFGLNTLNVDYTADETTVFKKEEIKLCGHCAKVDVVSPGDQLPFGNETWDFVLSSHVIEHIYDPIHAVQEWLRVIKPGGYVYIIAPHKERTFDKNRPRTTLQELIARHESPNPQIHDDHQHYSVWITQDFLDLCKHMNWKVIAVQDVDDKVGNGFTVVIQKEKHPDHK